MYFETFNEIRVHPGNRFYPQADLQMVDCPRETVTSANLN